MTLQPDGQLWVWRMLHLLVALSLPVAVTLILAGCIKAKEEPADLGPEYTEDQIDLALSKAVSGVSFNGIAVGQYVTYSINRRLENDEATISLGASKVKVVAKTEDPKNPNEVKYTLEVIQSTRLEDGTFETVVKEAPLILEKSAAALAALHVSSAPASIRAKPIRRSYHRLSQVSELIDPPYLVRNRPDCGGLPGCKIAARHVRYDMVDWYSETEFRKLAFDLSFSTTTPYLPYGPDGSMDRFTGLLISNCVATQVLITGRTVFVRDCVNLEDVQK